MKFFCCLLFDLCFVENAKKIENNTERYLLQNKYQHFKFQNFTLENIQFINLDHYNKVAYDYFSIITENTEIKKRIVDLLSNNYDSNKKYLYLIFKQYLQQFNYEMLPDTRCLTQLKFVKALAYFSYSTIFKLSNIKNLTEYIIIRDQVFKSIELKFKKNCANNIVQLFNKEEYKKINFLFVSSKPNETLIRRRRFAANQTTTSRRPFSRDDIKKVFIGAVDKWDCSEHICIYGKYQD
ncbi:putative SP-containing protein [Vairimorpha necatrix]|uniref:SP-containing protein n=1 Tax=Vairimorpha necatrix TaxID=6039 RepID=A0AAX4JAG7_9MICR